MKKLIKNIVIFLVVYLVYDQTREIHGIPLFDTELLICQMVGLAVGSVFHLGLYYGIPVFIMHRIYRKFTAVKTSDVVA